MKTLALLALLLCVSTQAACWIASLPGGYHAEANGDGTMAIISYDLPPGDWEVAIKGTDFRYETWRMTKAPLTLSVLAGESMDWKDAFEGGRVDFYAISETLTLTGSFWDHCTVNPEVTTGAMMSTMVPEPKDAAAFVGGILLTVAIGRSLVRKAS